MLSGKNDTGQAQVEFALTILFVVLLIFGIFEMIMMIYTYNVLADSAKEGVRYAIVRGSDIANSCPASCTPSITSVVTGYAQTSFHDVSNMTVTVNYLDGGSNAAPNRVQVQVSYPYKPLVGFAWATVTVHAAAEGRIFF
jgi:Flp pilus assembly protein TadG